MQQKTNFTWLLIALLVFLVVVPIAEDVGIISRPIVRAAMFSWLLAFGVWSLRGFGRFFYVGIGLAVTGIVLNIFSANLASDSFSIGSFAAVFGFIAVAIWFTGQQVVLGNENQIDANRVIGAISLYLLWGVLWAISYAVLEILAPGSFVGFAGPLSQGWSGEWLYFSFVTMTTLGYGDLAPLSATARTLAYMQAVFGQFYIAILVAGLVSAYITKHRQS